MQILTFPKTLGLEFLGRNGHGRLCGILITPLKNSSTIYLEPITSQGRPGRCALEIPAVSVRAFAKKLEAAAAELGSSTETTTEAPETPEELMSRFSPHGEHPQHPRSDWRYEVANGDTQRGYWEYVAAKLDEYAVSRP